MPTMTIRYPETLEPVIKKLMLDTGENTKNGAINASIRNYSNLLSEIEFLTNRCQAVELKYNILLSRVENFSIAQQELFNFNEISLF